MRIAIDLQGAQSASRRRGIGRYPLELALGLARNRGEHELAIALNDAFPDSIPEIREAFRGLLPGDAIRIWSGPSNVNGFDPGNKVRRDAGELIREAFLASLNPDLVLVTSMFEGYSDDAVLSAGRLSNMPTAVVLYDLIPFLNEKTYLTGQGARVWYHEKLDFLRCAQHLLAISDSASQEAIAHLGWDPRRVTNISAGANPMFRPTTVSEARRNELLRQYGLRPGFVMYTGGIDPRKNIERLIRSYSRLSSSLRERHQLAIVCNAGSESRRSLLELAALSGTQNGEVVLTGFVPDEDLVALYNLCKLFVFPSLHEGFGLPALEAIQCGKAVLASNTSSLPEVVGLPEALFDPLDETDISERIGLALTDHTFRARLEANALSRAPQFSWDATAAKAIQALERAFAPRPSVVPVGRGRRRRLAFVSPLPPERSGIADYSAELLPYLSRHYDIDLVVDQRFVDMPGNVLPIRDVDWFRANALKFDRILYQFGNSHFHQHMLLLNDEFPGVVVLHDFFLSGMQAHLGTQNWLRSIATSHGMQGLVALGHFPSAEAAITALPANLPVLQNAAGIIVHSNWSRRLADHWYGAGASKRWKIVAPGKREAQTSVEKRLEARERLGFKNDDVVVCSFGFVAGTKFTAELVKAFAQVRSPQGQTLRLVIAGDAGGDYGAGVARLIEGPALAGRAHVTGWLNYETYDSYLHAVDLAVQLRTNSRGETSAAVLDCMSHGLPTIVNANGAMGELDSSAVCMLPDQFTGQELTKAIEDLASNPELRLRLGNKARFAVAAKHDPVRCAEQYAEAIESFSDRRQQAVRDLPNRLASLGPNRDDAKRWAQYLAANFPAWPRPSRIFVDVTRFGDETATSPVTLSLAEILTGGAAPGDRWVMPVRWTSQEGYVLATRWVSRLTNGLEIGGAPEEPIDYASEDIFLVPGEADEVGSDLSSFLDTARNRGASVEQLNVEALAAHAPSQEPRHP